MWVGLYNLDEGGEEAIAILHELSMRSLVGQVVTSSYLHMGFDLFTWCTWVCEIYTGGVIVDGKLNVHLVPHSHDDVGWLKTVDQYYVGSNNSIQGACVENVLDSVVVALHRDPNRKFVFAELAFFQRWWEEQSVEVQEEVRKLVDGGQLEFVNGGWCMHDEAATHYIDMIDQTTLGHHALKTQFNTTPRAGWQIDPFGHSAVQAYLLGLRIDYQDRAKRKVDKSLEVIWRGSKTFGSSSQIFTKHFLYIIVLQVGSILKCLIVTLFPPRYADRTNAYWTGYFTSRPALKGYIRLLSGYYLAARQLEYMAGRRSSGPNTHSLGDALGIAQHHDAVTGTARQHTTNDYEKRLAIGASEAEAFVNSALTCLANSKMKGPCATPLSTLSQCQLLNISFCPPTEKEIPEGKSLVVVAYNSLGWNRTDIIRIPLDNVTSNLRDFYTKAYLGISPGKAPKYWILFQVSLPPLGWNTYFVSKASGKGKRRKSYVFSNVDPPQNDTIEIGPGNLKLSFSKASGQLKRMFNSKTGVDIPVQQSYLWYGSSTGDTDDQSSGAYIFRPNGAPPTLVSRSVPIKVVHGSLVDEVHQQFDSWIYQVIRLYKIKSMLKLNSQFGIIERIGLFKLINRCRKLLSAQSGIFTTDNKSEFSVLVDRAVGGARLTMDKRMLFDDSRGVGEPLDETVCVGETSCEGLTIKEVKEMSLSANQEKSQMKKMTWKVEGDNSGEPEAIRALPVQNMSNMLDRESSNNPTSGTFGNRSCSLDM
ncbi:hypothetical protein C3L33_00450, partial [Rhododendron williamsianum]